MFRYFYKSIFCAIAFVMVFMVPVPAKILDSLGPWLKEAVLSAPKDSRLPENVINADTVIVGTQQNVAGVVRGPRPVVDFMAIPDSLLMQGHLTVKFYEHALPFLETINAENFSTGIRDLDTLNKKWGVIDIVSDYDTVFYKKEFAERHRKWGLHLWYQIHFPKGTDIKQAMIAYRGLSSWVEVVEPEIIVSSNHFESEMIDLMTTQQVIFNDPQFHQQWNFNNTGQTGGNADADIDIPEAWTIETGKKNVIVAIIDSGIDTTHTDLRSNLWIGNNGEKFGYNFYGSVAPLTPGNHGTHVAGIIGAVNNNSNRVSGIAGGDGSAGSGVTLMSCQVSNPAGSSFSSRAIKRAFIWSADRGAAIAQNSWGTLPPNSYNTEALEGIDYFIENGGGTHLDKGIVIFSAGNSNLNAKIFPAAYERVIAVAATNHQDARSSYSSFGSWVDIAAPGGEGSGTGRIISTTPMNVTNGFGYMSGTSAASPHVTGVAALILSMAEGKLSSDDVRSVLLQTVDDHYSQNQSFAGLLGTGRVNAYNALVKTQELKDRPTVAPVVNFTAEFVNCGNIRLRWNNSGNGNFMIVKSTAFKGLTGLPEGNYQLGDQIEGGGEVIYQGNGNVLNIPVNEYMDFVGFKIWRKENGNYGKGSFALLSEVYPCSAPVLYVKEGGTGDGSSWQNASGDLQMMIERAAPGSAVHVAAGTYKPRYIGGNIATAGPSDRNSFFLLNKRVRLLGGFPNNNNSAGINDRNPVLFQTILSGDFNGNDHTADPATMSENSYHVLVTVDTREPAEVNLIDGFTITGGNANGTGGESVRGIQIANNCGGGWFNAGGVFKVSNLVILNNRAENGGGWYNLGGSCSLTNVRISGNKGFNGGGWYNIASNASLTNCIIENNVASGGTGEGGGWYNYSESPSIYNCRIINNTGSKGGGLYHRVGNPIFLSTLIANNTALEEGGGLYQFHGVPNFLNVNIVNNRSHQRGGGVYSTSVANSLNISNSILWGNQAPTGGQIQLTNANILNIKYSIVEDWSPDLAKFVLNINPQFNDPISGDYTLTSCSPAINKGNNILLAGLINGQDLGGQTRFYNGQVDLGAYEFQSIAEPTSLSNNEILVALPVFSGVTALNNGCDFAARIEGVNSPSGNIFSVNSKIANTSIISSGGWSYVQRYTQIKPSIIDNNLFARITLYFKKEEFDRYNANFGISRGLTLPQNLKIIQYRGTISSGFDDPFEGEQVIITPNMNDVVLDENTGIWKVTFNVYGFSTFFVTTQSMPDALPVTLVNFTGQPSNENTVALNWSSTDEINFKEFVVQRSVGSLKDFDSIGKVSAAIADGTVKYSFIDDFHDLPGMTPEVAYYRLKLIDLDDTYTYSDWISVLLKDNRKLPELVIYPNPVTDRVYLKFPVNQQQFSIQIFDTAGNTVMTSQFGNHQEIPLQNLASGEYLIKLTGKGWQTTKKITKL